MTSLLQISKDLFCGCMSGWGQVVSMLPFQNIKVKVVSKPDQYNKGYIHAFNKTIKEEGFFSFYKGMMMPLLGVGAQVALQFGVVQSLKKIIKSRYADADGNLHWKYSFLSGTLAGFPSALVVTVLDHARFRVLLVKQKGAGSVQTAINIYRQYGLRKLYLGFNSTWLRQSFLGVYFGVYDSLMIFAKNKKYNLQASSMISGGLAGVTTWALIYPIDYAKTKIQSDSLANPQYKNSIQCLTKEVKTKGLKVMYTGFNIMILRAFVANGVGFLCFQYTKRLLY